MESGEQIIQYLEELAEVLIDFHVTVPFHMLVAGGAYMLLQKKRQTTLLEGTDTAQAYRVHLQTFKRSFEEICAGSDPWIPLGNFMHQFFGYYKHLRSELVRESIEVSDNVSPEQFQWAVFCAASVEYLCGQYNIACPEWALNSQFSLEEPWYYAIGADLQQVREKLRQTTPEPFRRRNIFCGDRTYRNKYEYEGRQGRRKTA